MNKYKIHFWDQISNIIEAESIEGIIEYLWQNEKVHIYNIMKHNGELLLYKKEDKTLLWNNEYAGSRWFDLDTVENSISYQEERSFFSNHKCILPELGIDKLNFKQFHNLVMLMWKELNDDYGGLYIEFYQEIKGEWINILDD